MANGCLIDHGLVAGCKSFHTSYICCHVSQNALKYLSPGPKQPLHLLRYPGYIRTVVIYHICEALCETIYGVELGSLGLVESVIDRPHLEPRMFPWLSRS